MQTEPYRANRHPETSRASLGGSGATQLDAKSRVLAQNWWAVALRGICGIVFGVVALAAPLATMLTLALLFAGYLLADGVLAIIAAARAASAHQRWALLLAEGALNLVMGVAAALFPDSAVLAFVLITAAWALLTGGLMLAAAFSLHMSHGRWWLALSGIVSLLLGILLAISPLIGAVVLTSWLGIYALIFGVLLLTLGLRLRRQGNRAADSMVPRGP